MRTARDIKGSFGSYGHLPAEAVYEWATEQADLSTAFAAGKIKGTSSTKAGRRRKQKVMEQIHRRLKDNSCMSYEQIRKRMDEIATHLEDPGLLKNFEFFDIPSSDYMLQFYFAMWDRRIAELMGYLHSHGKNLLDVVHRIPEDDAWSIMARFEGMIINEQKKSKDIVDFILSHNITRATSFGGGNVPERYFGLPKDLSLTIFDDGPVSPIEELFPDPSQRLKVNYVHESLAKAPSYTSLLNSQELVWMHGVSMYLDEERKNQMTGAILAGLALLKPEGYMKYDYLLWTESMRRTIRTQNWPYDPKNPMVIFKSADEAIEQGKKTLQKVNAALEGKAFIEASDPKCTLIEPWGISSVRFEIRKFV